MFIGYPEISQVTDVSDHTDYTVRDLLILWNESKDGARYRDFLRRRARKADMGLTEYIADQMSFEEVEEIKKDKARDYIKEYKKGSITDETMAECIINLNWDGSDPDGAMKISPERAMGIVEGLSISTNTFSDKKGKHANLVNMILDAFYRWYIRSLGGIR